MAADEEPTSKGMAGHEGCQNCSVEKCSSMAGQRCATKRKAEEAAAACEESPLKVCKVEAAPEVAADSLKPALEAVREKRLTRLPQEEINWTLAHVVDGPVPHYYESLKLENPSLLPSPEEQMDRSTVILYDGARAFYAVRERFAKYQALVRAEYEKRGYVEVDDDFLARRAHLQAYNDVLRAKSRETDVPLPIPTRSLQHAPLFNPVAFAAPSVPTRFRPNRRERLQRAEPKHHRPTNGDEAAQPPPKRPRHDGDQAEPEPAPAPARVQLNPADCNLDFDVGAGGLRGEALHGGGFAYCWSGARATAGVRGGGRYCFGCRVVAEQAVEMDDTEAGQRHLCRVGVSRGDDPVGGLGEAGGHSFGFGGTGKLSHQGKFFDYGARFGVGDTIVCALDLDSKPMASIGFAKNGEWLGIAQYFDAGQKGFGLVDAPGRPMQWESAIFPHVLLKNVVVEMQFSTVDGLEPVDGYEPWTSALADGNAVFGPVFPEQKECEVMMMVGLPASGKTTWAEKWVKEHPEKRFVLLGTNLALDQMKVPGLLRKNNYGERFDRLMDHATQIFNTLLDRAAKIPRNYILDQTNVYKSARIRKLRPFANYYKIAVVVFPSPSELNSRAAKRFQEMGKDVPAEAVDQMTANFVLPLSKDMPGSKEPFDEVIFVELARDDAQRNLDEMKRLLPRASTPSYGNSSNQNVSSAYTGTVSVAGPSPSSGFEPPKNYSYGQGVHAPGAPAGYSNAPYQIQSSYSNAPYQQQTYASYLNSSYPSTADQHQVPTSYPSTTNQHQAYGSYPSAPLPGYGSQNAYGSQGYPSPYSSPDYATNLYQTPEPVGDYGYGGSGYVPAAPAHAQPLPQAVHQQMPYRHDGASSYQPYGQQPLDARYANTSSQYGAAVPAPMPPPRGAILLPVPGPLPSAPPPPPYYMNAQPGRW